MHNTAGAGAGPGGVHRHNDVGSGKHKPQQSSCSSSSSTSSSNVHREEDCIGPMKGEKTIKFRCQFFLDFLLFYRVFGCFLATGVQKHYKKRFTKKNVSKGLYKKIDKNPKPIFFDFSNHVFLGRFSMRGVQIVQKHKTPHTTKKISNRCL
jgi:hypothetical protein